VAEGCAVEALIPQAELMDELAAMLSRHARVRRFPFISTYDRRSRTLGALADLGQQQRLSSLFGELDADLLHLNQQVAEDGCDLLLAAHRSGRPWVSTIHVGRSAKELGALGGGLRDWLSGQVLRRVDGTHIAVSLRSREQLSTRFPHASARFRAVYNGVAIPVPSELERERRKAREEWGVTDDQIVMGCVGRIEAQKNPAFFVEAAARLQVSERVQCVWVGDGSLRSTMAAKASEKGVRLHIDGWRQDADRRLAGFDIFFLPSLFEGLPFAVLEAMHAGLAIVASQSDGMGEAIDDGISGFLCDDEQQFIERLQRMVDDAELRTRLGTAAKTEARAKFSLDIMARKTLEVYWDALGQAAAP
jgi:glycosyltransferase involved in cell wall biosynthesis